MKGVKIDIDPNPVIQNDFLTVTVSVPDGGDPSGWFMRIVAVSGSPTKLAPRGLDVYGSPKSGKRGVHDCRAQTVGFEPGDYLVDVAREGGFDAPGMASRRFTVEAQEIVVASPGRLGPDWDSGRRGHGLP